MVSAVGNHSAASNLVSVQTQQPPKAAPQSSPRNEGVSVTERAVSTDQKVEAKSAEKQAATNAENNATKVTIRQQEPQPSTTNRDAKPVEQYQAVSAIRS